MKVYTPKQVAAWVGVSPKTVRGWLRLEYKRVPAQRGAPWRLTAVQAAAIVARFG